MAIDAMTSRSQSKLGPPPGRSRFIPKHWPMLDTIRSLSIRSPPRARFQSPGLAREYPLDFEYGSSSSEYTHWQYEEHQRIETTGSLTPLLRFILITAKKHGVVLMAISSSWKPERDRSRVKAKSTEAMMVGVVNVLHGWEGDANESMLTELGGSRPGHRVQRRCGRFACRIRKS